MKTGPGVAVAASLLAATLGGCAEADPSVHNAMKREYDKRVIMHANPEDMTISPAEKRRLIRSYAEIVKVGGKVTAKLVFVDGRKEFVCHEAGATQQMVTSLNSPKYCPQPNTIVMTGAWVRRIAQGTSLGDKDVEGPAGDLALGHEAGHNLEPLTLEHTPIITLEQRADCRAGFIMGKLAKKGLRNKESIQDAAAVLQSLPVDAAHGSGKERIDAFMYGVAGKDCMLLGVS